MALVAALAVPARALADAPATAAEAVPAPWRFSSPPTCTITDVPGLSVELPPGYYLAEPAWRKLDLELHRLQEQETRLAAENDVFRKHASSGLGWKGTLLIAGSAFAAGMAAALVSLR